MKLTVLIDNIPKDDLVGEWGLSIYIEVSGHKILLDSGTSGKFADNAKALGIDLSSVDIACLSHAHYDHANGFERFFDINDKADVILQKASLNKCYSGSTFIPHYIGIHKGWLNKYSNRFKFVDGDYEIAKDIFIVSHKTPNLSAIGKAGKLYVKKGLLLVPDDFSHEQSLVIRTKKGLIICNSCSHAGADNIIKEVSKTFPGETIYAIIGGFHLFRSSEKDVRSFAVRVRETGITSVITGHCTGNTAYSVLHDELGDCVRQMYTGMTLEI